MFGEIWALKHEISEKNLRACGAQFWLRPNDEGACALARALENQVSMRARLQRVNLEGNPIGREGRAALERALLRSSCLLIC